MNSLFSKLVIILILFTVLIGCKKDNINSPDDIAGTYAFYEIEEYATKKIDPLPTSDGSTGKIVVTIINDRKEATVNLQSFEKGKKVAERMYNLKVSKDDDGDYSLVDKETNKLCAFFIDSEVDIYFVEGFRIGARKQ